MGSLFKTPEVQRQNPEADAKLAADLAAQEANKQAAFRKRQRRNSSLLAQGGAGDTSQASTLRAAAYGKETLGG